MKHFYAFLVLLLVGNLGFGQTTITIDFETTDDGYTPSGTTGSGFTDVFNRANPNIGGNSSFMFAVEDLPLVNPSIDIDQIDITGATEFSFSIDMLAHHFDDWDVADELLITYSVDGGAYQNLMWIQNDGDTFNSAASLDTDFDGDGNCGLGILPALTTGNSGCNVTNNTFETFSNSFIALSGNTTLDIRFQFNGLDATDEGIYLDNIVIDHDGGGTGNDTDTEVLDPISQVAATTITAANVTTSGTAEDVFGFEVEDQGTADGLATEITTMRFVPGPNNTADWTDHIQGITLLDGNVVSYTPTTSITDTEIVLTFGTPITVADNTSLEFLLGLYLNTTSIVDGSIIQLQIDAASSGFAADASGSDFIDPFTLGAVVGNNITVDVDASELVFSQQPPATVAVNSAMSDVIVEARDTNGNIDTDYNLDIDITSSGALSASPVTATAVSGTATFSTITHTSAGTGLLLTADDGLFPTVNSTAFDVAVLPVFIAIQDFETSPQTPVFTFSNSDGAFSTGSGPFPNDDNFVSGTRGWEASNETSTLTFGSIDVSSYDDIRLDFRLASFSGTSGNGNDGSDNVLVEVSTDNGATYSSEIEINGNNNARWSFDTGIGTATVLYDGDNTQANFTPSAGGNRTTDGYSFISITDLPNSSELVIRVTMSNNSGSEFWIIDDLTLSGILVPTNDLDTEVLDPISQVAATTITASNVTTSGTAEDVFGFEVEDQGTADGLSTEITTMRFVPGPNNTADWTDHIQGITLLDGNLVSYTPTTSITDTEIVLTFGTPITVADNTSLEFLLGLYLNTTSIVDGSIIQLQIDAASSGFEADAISGSDFIDPFTLGAVIGNNITIDVDVTQLIISQQPQAIVGLNVAMSDVILEAQDANGNIDTDYNLDVDITSTGTLSVSPVTETAVAGVTTFSTITHTAAGTGLILTVDDGLLPTVASTTFDVVVLPTTIAIQDFDGALPDWTYSNDIPFFDNSWGVDGYYGLIDISSAAPINLASMTGNILGENDLDDEGVNGTSDFATTTFSAVDVSLYENAVLTFDWQVVGYNFSTDNAGYEVFFDGVGQGFQFLVEGGVDPLDGSGTVSINIPNAISSVSLNILISNNGGSGYSGFDNFKVEGFLPSTDYEGNDSNGFAGPLGEGNLEITAFTGTTANFTYNRGSGAFGNNNDYIVIYVDSEAGGITTTSGLTDTGDTGRRAVSGFDGGNRSTINFPPGFEADFAIYLDENFAGVFDLVEGGSHNFVASADLSPTGTTLAASYDFSVNFADINTTAGAESFKFIATYINSDNAFRSNEFIGDSDYDNNALGNPGYTTVNMNTYYQVSSHKKGGRASSSVAGNWSDDASWANGNAPLTGDVISVNHDIVQDVNYNSINNLDTNSIEITGANTLTLNSGQTLEMSDGISGTGSLIVNGKLSITEGGFTDIAPTYGSGSTLEYRNITATYNRFNEWSDGSVLGAGVPDNVIIENATLDLTNVAQATFVDFTVGTDLSLLTSGSLTVDANESLTLGGNLSNTGGNLDLNSISTDYSSLVVGGTSTGDVIYRRHVNTFNNTTGSTTGSNDLISAPVTNSSQTFFDFRTANTNIPSGNIGGVFSYLFGPFDNDTNAYINFTGANDGDIITAGAGYRSASTDTSTFTFVGDVETGTVPVSINVGTLSQWNLVGNPYPSYISMDAFLTENNSAFNASSSGIYGYDGEALDGFTVRNLAYFVINPDEYIAPGQGFLVTSTALGATVNFTPSMRSTTSSDDFILGRQGISENAFITLEISSNNAMYTTDLFFLTDNVSLGLDPGFDTSVFGNEAPDDFAIFSHLIESNEGIDMAIQSLPSSSLSSVVVPLGVNVNNGQQFTISIKDSSLPSSVDIYLEDNVNNTNTLLNTSDYVFTAISDIKDTGRYFLRFTDNSLSTTENSFDNLNIYTSKTSKEIVVNGQLLENTEFNLYDIQGRLVLSTTLDNSVIENRIDVSNVNTGIYIVKLKNNSQEKSQKLILR